MRCGPGSGIRHSFWPWIREMGSGMEKFGSGIRDKHPGSATKNKTMLLSSGCKKKNSPKNKISRYCLLKCRKWDILAPHAARETIGMPYIMMVRVKGGNTQIPGQLNKQTWVSTPPPSHWGGEKGLNTDTSHAILMWLQLYGQRASHTAKNQVKKINFLVPEKSFSFC
jgi:hypothetical protein